MVSRHARKKAEKRPRQAGHDVEESLEQPLTVEFEGIPSADLFYEDKAGDIGNVSRNTIKQSDKGASKEHKVLKSAAILAAGRAASVLPSLEKRRKKQKFRRETPGSLAHTQQTQTSRSLVGTGAETEQAQLDLWADSSHLLGTSVQPVPTRKGTGPVAVEVDQPGCSYNPDAEQHQDAVAVAVAAEVNKSIASELQPKAPPRFSNEAAAINCSELDMLQVDDDETLQDNEASEEIHLAVADRPRSQQKTAAQRNRHARRKAADAELLKRQQRKTLGKDISRVSDLVAEIASEVSIKVAIAQRRKADKAEKRASEPPRLGKQLYEPAPVQVLLSEEIHGSLRQLKAAPMLARDRYKSLQQRGLVEPRSRAQFKPGRKLIVQDQYSSR